MVFTIASRLKAVISSAEKRKHLRQTWRFALKQVIRASSGRQISEVLEELQILANNLGNTLPRPPRPRITPSEFEKLATGYGAGKLFNHGLAYTLVDFEPTQELTILEVGIGTNNPKTPSSMGAQGKPGASLFLWRELFPNARVFGADVDRSSFVSDSAISSHYLDSTEPTSIRDLLLELSVNGASEFDLVIDDGLHTPESNLRLLNALHPLVKSGGFYVIEDIPRVWLGFWRIVATTLPGFKHAIIEAGSAPMDPCYLVLKRDWAA